MSTIDLITQGTSGHPARQYRKDLYNLKATVNLANAVTEKGSALVTGDVIQAIQIPAGTQVVGASSKVTTVVAGATNARYSVGQTGGTQFTSDVTLLSTGYANGTISFSTLYPTTTTVDVTLLSVQTSATSGVIEVNLLVADVS